MRTTLSSIPLCSIFISSFFPACLPSAPCLICSALRCGVVKESLAGHCSGGAQSLAGCNNHTLLLLVLAVELLSAHLALPALLKWPIFLLALGYRRSLCPRWRHERHGVQALWYGYPICCKERRNNRYLECLSGRFMLFVSVFIHLQLTDWVV